MWNSNTINIEYLIQGPIQVQKKTKWPELNMWTEALDFSCYLFYVIVFKIMELMNFFGYDLAVKPIVNIQTEIKFSQPESNQCNFLTFCNYTNPVFSAKTC